MKKVLSILLGAVMLFVVLGGLAACTKPENKGTPPLREDGYFPNITLSLASLMYTHYDEIFNNLSWSLTKNAYMDLVEEEYGIKFKLAIEVNDIGVYYEKLMAEVAAGKMADIACIGDSPFAFPIFKSANQNDLLADLTPYVKGTSDKAAPSEDVLEQWEASGDEIFYAGTFDGQIKTIPWVSDARSSANSFLYIREDWLERVGKQIPTTIDELTEVMRAFKINIDGAYGLVVGAEFMQGSCGIFDMFGVNPFYWYETEEGNLAMGLTDTEPMKAAITLLRDWYAEGLINSSEYNDFENMGVLHYTSQEITNGRAGVHFGTASMGFVGNTLRKNKDARFVTVPLFAADGYELAIQTKSDAFVYYVAGKNNKYPETVMKLYNLYVEVLNNDDNKYTKYVSSTIIENDLGEKIESWAPIQFAPVRASTAFDFDASRELLSKIQQKDSEGMNKSTLDIFEQYWDGVENGITYKNYWTVKQYEEGGVYEQLYDLYEQNNYTRNKFTGLNLPSMDIYSAEINPALILSVVAIIKGLEPVDYYDAAVDAWLSTGGQIMTDEVNTWWSSVKGS